MSAYDSKQKKMKRSNSKHNSSKETTSKFSSRRLSSNHEEMQVTGDYKPPLVNNLISNSEKQSPKKAFNSTASHPTQASYKKLTEIHNGKKKTSKMDQLLEKSKRTTKGSRSAAAKQHNTSSNTNHESKVTQSLFDQRKKSADEAISDDKRKELSKTHIESS